MCANDDFDTMLAYAHKAELSRRRFGALSVGAGLVSLLPPVADAAEVTESDVDIKTPDGTCDAYFVHPAKGTHPGVLVWPDIFGLRPAFREMGKRLAQSGYAVLVVNPFYRSQKGRTSGANPDFSDPQARNKLFALMGSLTPTVVVTDAKAFVPWLNDQKAVSKTHKMGTTGYCMGGPFTFRTAAAFPDRIGAGASFHGANLVTDKPDSPHLLVSKMKAQYLVAIAANDDQKQPEQKTVLREAFDRAHLPAEIEVYAGAQHGWCPPDSQVYNHDQAEKAWSRQLVLFKKALG